MSETVTSHRLSRLPSLDALRALGAIVVVSAHVSFNTGVGLSDSWGAALLIRGDVGVAIFFVLSGFLLFRPFAHASAVGTNRPGLGRFFWRRAVRLLPAYWLVVIVCLSVVPANGPAPASEWVRFMTLTHIYWEGWLRAGLTQSWSLATEVASYLVLPFMALVAVRRRWRPVRSMVIVLVTGVVISGTWFVLMDTGPLSTARHTLWLPTYQIWFSAGMALAIAHVALRTGTAPARWRILDDMGAAPGACWSMVLALMAIASTPLAGPLGLAPATSAELGFKTTLWLFAAALVLISAGFGPANRYKGVLSSPPARWLGTVSYGLFLWHPLVLEEIFRLENRPIFSGDYVITFLMTLAGGLALAALSYYILERPLLRWSSRWPRPRADRRRQDGEGPPRPGGQDDQGLRAQGGVPGIGREGEPAGDRHEGEREPRLQPA